ncbi:hypothetical protein Q4528_14650, partial [Staphylococcus pasteuri_A]|nr:hypothetical protein [Staphylococcus pasteuri_A]
MIKLFKSITLIATLVLWSHTALSASVNVMGPLWLDTQEQWHDFRDDLKTAKQMGVEAVTVD